MNPAHCNPKARQSLAVRLVSSDRCAAASQLIMERWVFSIGSGGNLVVTDQTTGYSKQLTDIPI